MNVKLFVNAFEGLFRPRHISGMDIDVDSYYQTQNKKFDGNFGFMDASNVLLVYFHKVELTKLFITCFDADPCNIPRLFGKDGKEEQYSISRFGLEFVQSILTVASKLGYESVILQNKKDYPLQITLTDVDTGEPQIVFILAPRVFES